jgi:pimeloyl-ACP methyl ester carboxylesterase
LLEHQVNYIRRVETTLARTLYGLLVAIDRYPSPVPKLHGCVNDIEALQEVLEGLAIQDQFELDLLVLTNEDATRGSVIEGFQQHLAGAGANDVVLFYYSGHGSQEDAPPEFWHLEPDRLDETLVCYDSRIEGQWDLADKELAALVHDVAQSGAHVVCILDCCHSGSGTRDAPEIGTSVRRAPTDRRQRPLESFFGSGRRTPVNPEGSGPAGWGLIPAGRHILLAACASSETAKETSVEGRVHGAFSASLLATLKQTKGSITYRDLLKRVQAQVKQRVADQVPQIEAFDVDHLRLTFLGGAIDQYRSSFTLTFDNELGWIIDGGAVHGVPPSSTTEATRLAVFPLHASVEDRRHIPSSVAAAKVTHVLPQLSRVAVEQTAEALDEAMTYRAVIVGTPLMVATVALTGDPAAVTLIQSALQPQPGFAAMLRLADSPAGARYLISEERGSFAVLEVASNRLLLGPVPVSQPAADKLVRDIEHITRWKSVFGLENVVTGLGSDPIELRAFRLSWGSGSDKWTEIPPDREWLVEYVRVGKSWKQPELRLQLENRSDVDLHCAVLWLGEDFSISSGLVAAGTILVPARTSASINSGEPIFASVPDNLWREGRTEVRDLVKVLASTEPFDPAVLDQEKLGRPNATPSFRLHEADAFTRLLHRTTSRDLSRLPSDDERTQDWTTLTVGLTVVRPLDAVEIPSKGGQQHLTGGLTVTGHSHLRARVHMESPSEVGRGLGNLAMPSVLRDDPVHSQPLLFGDVDRGAQLSALVLEDVSGFEHVSIANPLLITVAADLPNDQVVLPYAWDGEFYVPLGVSRHGQGKLEIELRQLPQPQEIVGSAERAVVASIRILFQKLATSRLGIPYDYPRLALVSLGGDGTPTYEHHEATIHARLSTAKNLLLYVHGIFGDTPGMLSSSGDDAELVAGITRTIAKSYDAVLAFDYESINTGIRQTATALKAKLESVGVGSVDGPSLDIVAHSMGGLVSRWFIEREGGHQVVRRLVTLGTPHLGSPWPTLHDWATAAVAIGLNGLTEVAWPVRLLGDLVAATEIVDVMLDEMGPNSEFLTELASSPNPNVPYSLIVGDTSAIAAATKGGTLERLLARLSPQRLLHATTSLAFFKAPNDIAVSVQSAQGIPLTHLPRPPVIRVPCDHLTYFRTSASLAALADLLSGGHTPVPNEATSANP